MQIHLTELEHQKKAIEAILHNFPNLSADQSGSPAYANPILEHSGDEKKFIDIKMETGTGKTYVYTRAMYELHRKYGLYKFIIIVPSLAIKEGTKNFIESGYARQHFAKYYPNTRLELQTINAGDFNGKKGQKRTFPAALSVFCEAPKSLKNIIQCLLISDKGFLDKRDKGDKRKTSFFKDDFDQTLFGGYSCPADGIKSTLPVVIIDEPHRIKREGSTYQNITERIKPQMIIRFGATFPERKRGKGRNAVIIKDYYQGMPQYDLCAVDAFNQDLVKGVSVQYPSLPENEASEKYKVKKADAKQLVLTKDNKDYEIGIDESLPGFDGNIRYESGKKLSNFLELSEGMELVRGVFSNSYQEILIEQAINAHFETEISNFFRKGFKVKTITLFFIDNIYSYRMKDGWLKGIFEKRLRAKLDELLKQHTSGEYHDYLLATKNNISGAHGGYFAQDWGQPDSEAIAEELQDILHKERTLTFRKTDGSWNIRRFFFSKWTLKEGWDNPNVFTICKLRSSGSETSKIQEAGRGLRLPVDEQGNRLASGEWKLNFIIGYDEKDFAQKLIGEINQDTKIKLDNQKLTDEMIKTICNFRKITEMDLLEKLDNSGIINRTNEFKPGGYDKLIEQYPELLSTQVKQGKITSPQQKQKKIRLHTDNWQKIKEFWQQASRRYMVCLERLDKGEIETLIAEILDMDGIFDDNKNVSITVNSTSKNEDGQIVLTQQTITIDNPGKTGQLTYSKFVENLSKRTSIPPQVIHKTLWKKLMGFYQKGISLEEINSKINCNSLEKTIAAWHEKFAERFAEKYHYDPLNFTAETSIMKDGSFLQELSYGLIGSLQANDIVSDQRNLYEVPLAYDSEKPEHEILRIKPPEKISVFGKIPRRAIKVPVYTGGSTTPDFIYAVQQADSTHLYILIETKSQDMRGAEKRAVEAQNRLFKNLKNVNVEWHLIKSAAEVQELLDDFAKQK
ncbi:MAG: type III restriction-modification system endonuclease [Elusimicrobiales bacterium]|nr:type III restriction-modification system endonuclease [Elusimicrobiales bacterium]